MDPIFYLEINETWKQLTTLGISRHSCCNSILAHNVTTTELINEFCKYDYFIEQNVQAIKAKRIWILAVGCLPQRVYNHQRLQYSLPKSI